MAMNTINVMKTVCTQIGVVSFVPYRSAPAHR
jgi:hypothetical protein